MVILIHSFISFSYIYLRFFSQTLTTLILGRNQIGDAGIQYLADALRLNKVIIFISLHLSLALIFISIHRHSSIWALVTIQSEMLELNVWLMHYGITRYFSFSSAYTYLHLHSQTLTKLSCFNSDQIRATGAQYLADALQDNKVIILISLHLSLYSSSYPFTDTHRTERWG